MALQNVTLIEQEHHQKTWFQRFRNKIAATSATVGSYALVSSAHAEGADLSGIGAAITGQLSSAQGIGNHCINCCCNNYSNHHWL